jgi:hypothetical protein
MSTDFATMQADAGAAIVRRLANATLTVDATSVEGLFTRMPVAPTLGDAGMQAERVTFLLVTADLGDTEVEEDTTVSIDGRVYAVALRTDDGDKGQTVLELKVPA